MKKSIMVFIVIDMPFFLIAQETTKQQEAGIAFSNFVIGAELLPYFTYSYSIINRSYIGENNESKTTSKRFNYGLSNTLLLLTLAYRF